MSTLVMKFGGASVATPESFAHIADIIASRRAQYEKIVVVISAMGGMTDYLLTLARQVHHNPPNRELDMLVSVGERISISLLAMALSAKGVDAISFTGSQSGIITNTDHTEARIIEVKPGRVLQRLNEKKIVIVAGFQGVSTLGEITTLGRGGTDTSAVAMAVALEAKKVEFFKDVDGMYEFDPKLHPTARHLPKLDYFQALEIIAGGAKILQGRAVQLAQKNSIPLHILSFNDFFSPNSLSTWIASDTCLEKKRERPIYEIEFNR
jgi:aspartate kinase